MPESRITTEAARGGADPVGDLRDAVVDAAQALDGGASLSDARLERPPRPDFGDYSSNAPMLLAPALGAPPREVAERLAGAVADRLGAALDRAEVAGPGFLNLHLSDEWHRDAVAAMEAAGASFGTGVAPRPERVLVEFVSANPTGPVTVASGRHAAYGDSLCRLLERAGHAVEREYYVNDAGTQVELLGRSVIARARGEEVPEGGYEGDYVGELAERLATGGDADAAEVAERAVALLLERIRATLERFRVRFDGFFSERGLHERGELERAIDLLREGGHVFESESAVWLRTTRFGDDKDRVLRRQSGEHTYFAADVAYHLDKRSRGADRLVDVIGADHHGYVGRMLAAWQALGGAEGALEYVIMQLVALTERGAPVAMSKRRGDFVTLDELIDDIGVDAARFFLLQRSHDTKLDLDLALAREQSQENPVYYVQYAHARIASILRKAGEARASASAGPPPELHPSARALVKRLLAWPEEVRTAAERRAPHRVTAYVHDLAQDFSAFYRDVRVVGGEDEGLALTLCLLTRDVIAAGLGVLGVEAPEQM